MDTRLHRKFDTIARPKKETTSVPERQPRTVDEAQRARLRMPSVAHAVALVLAHGGRLDRVGGALLQLQRDFGNHHVQQMLSNARRTAPPGPIVQASLIVGGAGDRHEQEADRIARHVTGAAARRSSAGGAAPDGAGQKPVAEPATGSAVDPLVQQAVRGAGAGQLLPGHARVPMERALGADFGAVRVHTDARADQVSRVLGARAFTTGNDIFFRRGEYRLDGMAGRQLLAHELTHVAQQTAAGTAVIQRAVIDGLNTENPPQLRALRRRAREMMQLNEIDEMLAKIPPTGSRSASEKDLAEVLDIQRTLIAVKTTGTSSRPPEPSQPASRSAEQSPQQPQPRRRPLVSPSPATREVAEVPGIQQSLVPVQTTGTSSRPPEPSRPAPRSAEQSPQQPQPRRNAAPPLGTAAQEAEAGEKAAVSSLVREAEDLLRLAGALSRRPDTPAGEAAWLNRFADLEQRGKELSERVTKVSLAVRRDKPARDTIDRAQDAIQAAGSVKLSINRAEEIRRQRERDARDHQDKMSLREQEVQQAEHSIGVYIGTLDVTPPGLSLPIKWAFGQALTRLHSHGDERIAALLQYLKQVREDQQAKHDEGPWLELTGNTDVTGVRGQAHDNAIELSIPFWQVDTVALLTHDDEVNKERRERLITAIAKGFIHETAHLRQLRIYENVSHPFREPKQIISPHTPDAGIPWQHWPGEVKDAYQEFADGGVQGQAKSDPEWQRVFKGITHAEYYQQGVKDMRARELVSHLIEIVYAWGSREKFDTVFPKCSHLLERAIIRGA